MYHVNVIAEIGCNHCGDINIAKKMIEVAKQCGADFVKFQKRDIESMSEETKNRPYSGPHSFGNTYGEHRSALEFRNEQWFELMYHANQVNIGFFATPFDVPSAEFLIIILGCKYVKMGSTQIHDPAMVDWFSKLRNIKVIMSSGMCDRATLSHLSLKIQPHVIMQTTSCYPCKEEDVNLRTLRTIAHLKDDGKFFPEVGLSGHYSSGNGAIEAAAVALGATWIERHFTLDRTWKGTDQAASLEPEGLKTVVKAVRSAERALGSSDKKFLVCENATYNKIQASISTNSGMSYTESGSIG